MAVTMKSAPRQVLSILMALQFACLAGGAARAGLRGACAKVDITPPLGITLPVRAMPSSGDSISTEIQVLKLGGTYIPGLPGEVLVEVGPAVRKRAGVENLFLVTLANDAVGYVCPQQAYEQGGYEPESGTHLAKGAAEIMIEQALALINEVK